MLVTRSLAAQIPSFSRIHVNHVGKCYSKANAIFLGILGEELSPKYVLDKLQLCTWNKCFRAFSCHS